MYNADITRLAVLSAPPYFAFVDAIRASLAGIKCPPPTSVHQGKADLATAHA
jgi:hypothetical protein